MELKNKTKNLTLAENLMTATTFKERSKGLLGRSSLEKGHALWIHRCNSIHTFFMKFPIDIVFVDKDLKVTSMSEDVPPWRMTIPVLRASSVFEFAAGSIRQQVAIGDQLYVDN